MTEDLEAPYVFQAKQDEKLENLELEFNEKIWGDLTLESGVSEFWGDYEPLDLFFDMIRNIAITREVALKAPYENRNAIKAACFDEMYKPLCELVERAAEYRARESFL